MDSTLILASTPEAMAAGQHRLIGDVDAKLSAAILDAEKAKDMWKDMRDAGMNYKQGQNLHARMTARVTYLAKIKQALEAGYVMMPDMPGTVVAVRREDNLPPTRGREFDGSYQINNAGPLALPAGSGRYFSPRRTVHSRETSKVGADGKLVKSHRYWAGKLKDPDGLDRRFVRPEVMSKVAAAFTCKVFDELVTVHSTGGMGKRRKDRDPIVLGRVVDERNGSVAAFLVAWFVDTLDI